MEYGRRVTANNPRIFEILFRDAMGTLHRTGERVYRPDHEIHEIAWWRQTGSNDDEEKETTDWRAIEPVASCFPNPKGWKIGNTKVDLDKLNIKKMTHERTMRKFKLPACEEKWAEKLNAELPFKKIWRRKPTFATPRDRATGMKVLHRTIYLRRDETCLLCDDGNESISHTCACAQYHRKFWNPLIDLAVKMGETRPENTAVWVATGAISKEKTMSNEVSSIWDIGWRCIYAEICKYRNEGGTFDPQRALKRTDAYRKGQGVWTQVGKMGRHGTVCTPVKDPRMIAEKYREKKLLEMDIEANYAINPHLEAMARSLQLM